MLVPSHGGRPPPATVEVGSLCNAHLSGHCQQCRKELDRDGAQPGRPGAFDTYPSLHATLFLFFIPFISALLCHHMYSIPFHYELSVAAAPLAHAWRVLGLMSHLTVVLLALDSLCCHFIGPGAHAWRVLGNDFS